jgi:protein-L-isoaspartate O-methyltransferase
MNQNTRHDAWQAGDSYDLYMGRWSRQVAPRFLDWLDAPAECDWLEIGCGTGALSAAILARCRPRSLLAVEPSQGFIDQARRPAFSSVTPSRCRRKTPAATSSRRHSCSISCPIARRRWAR